MYTKDIIENNRTFRLTFFEDKIIKGLWYCLGEEIYRKKKNVFDFGWKKKVFEFCTTNENIVEMALGRIQDIFDDEQIRLNIIKSLDNF